MKKKNKTKKKIHFPFYLPEKGNSFPFSMMIIIFYYILLFFILKI